MYERMCEWYDPMYLLQLVIKLRMVEVVDTTLHEVTNLDIKWHLNVLSLVFQMLWKKLKISGGNKIFWFFLIQESEFSSIYNNRYLQTAFRCWECSSEVKYKCSSFLGRKSEIERCFGSLFSYLWCWLKIQSCLLLVYMLSTGVHLTKTKSYKLCRICCSRLLLTFISSKNNVL